MIPDWDPHFPDRSPMFAPLRVPAAALRTPHWPTLQDLRRVLAARRPAIRTRSGMPISLMPQAPRSSAFEAGFEARIYSRGEVQIRERNWHDLLNVLVWLAFPAAKAALNARHYRGLLEQKARAARNRGPVQDAMTLFDEGGVIVAARDRGLLRLIDGFEWKTLFWRHRARVITDMRFYLFGHALYEKALDPFPGITARGLLFEVAADFFDAPLNAQLEHLDTLAAARLDDVAVLRSPKDLAPVPILGVPGWCAENALESYYDDMAYFRPGRARPSSA